MYNHYVILDKIVYVKDTMLKIVMLKITSYVMKKIICNEMKLHEIK